MSYPNCPDREIFNTLQIDSCYGNFRWKQQILLSFKSHLQRALLEYHPSNVYYKTIFLYPQYRVSTLLKVNLLSLGKRFSISRLRNILLDEVSIFSRNTYLTNATVIGTSANSFRIKALWRKTFHTHLKRFLLESHSNTLSFCF